MALNQIDGERFSAIAASSNPTLKRDCAKIARVFHDIIGAKAPNVGVKARSPLAGIFAPYIRPICRIVRTFNPTATLSASNAGHACQ